MDENGYRPCFFANTKPRVLLRAGSCWKHSGLYPCPAHRRVGHYRLYIHLALAQHRGRSAARDLILNRTGSRRARRCAFLRPMLFLRLVHFIGRHFGLTGIRFSFLFSFLWLPRDQPDQRNIVPKPRQGPLQPAAVAEA